MKYHQDLMPSAIRDWLEEELKARGINDREYSEYLVSLLHPGTINGPEQELHFRQREEMEALVEELCEKLQEANGDVRLPSRPCSPSVPSDLGGLSSPEEPAESDYGSLDPDDGPMSRRIEDFLKPLERDPARDPSPMRAADVSMPRGPSLASPRGRPAASSVPWGRAEDGSVPRGPTDDSPDGHSMPHWRADDFSGPQGRVEDFSVPWGRAVEFARTRGPGRDVPRGRADGFPMPRGQPDNFPMPQERPLMPQGWANDISMPQGRALMLQGRADNFSMPHGLALMPQGRADNFSMPQGRALMPQGRADNFSMPQGRALMPQGRADNFSMPQGRATMPPWRADNYSMPQGRALMPQGRADNFSMPQGRALMPQGRADNFSMPQGRALMPQGRADNFSMPQGRALMPQGRADNFSMPQGRALMPQGRALMPQGRTDTFSMPQGRAHVVSTPPKWDDRNLIAQWLANLDPGRVSKFSTTWRQVDESSMPKKRRENEENGATNNRYYSLFNKDYMTPILGVIRSGNASGGSSNLPSSSDHRIADNRHDSAQDNDLNMYEDMPRGISDLLNAPPRPQRSLFSSIYDDGKREYIPYGASITRSIWSNDRPVDSDSNWTVNGPDLSLGYRFSSISIDTQAKPLGSWPPAINSPPPSDINRNPFLDNNQDGFRSLPNQWDGPIDWDRPVVWERPIAATNDRTIANSLPNCDALSMCWECSLRQVHHDRGRSGFAEFYPRPWPQGPPSDPPARNCNQSSVAAASEDLLESDSTHFKPIAQDQDACEDYEDGTTFAASRSLLKVAFRRSDSGSLWLGNDKYHALQNRAFTWPPNDRYAVKFHVCRTDEACQTEETDEEFVDDDIEEPTDVILYPSTESPTFSASSPSPNAYPDEFAPSRSECVPSRSECYPSPSESYPSSSESDPISPDLVSSRQSPSMECYDEMSCGRCRAEKMRRRLVRGASDVWRGEEVCQACLRIRGELSRPAASLRLREDVIQDGEELLSDLEFVQKAFKMADDELPSEAEDSTDDLYELLVATRERKRRYSVMIEYEDVLIDEDVRIQIATANSLRSVTL